MEYLPLPSTEKIFARDMLRASDISLSNALPWVRNSEFRQLPQQDQLHLPRSSMLSLRPPQVPLVMPPLPTGSGYIGQYLLTPTEPQHLPFDCICRHDSMSREDILDVIQ